MVKKLIAGPWVGEFGWELFCWQGHVRKLSKQYDEAVIISRPGTELLYIDFANEFIPYTPVCTELNGFRCEGFKEYILPERFIDHDWLKGSDFNINFDYNGNEIKKEGLFFEQEFKSFKKRAKKGRKRVLFNVRNKCSDRDWPYENWVELSILLLNEGFEIKTIGTKEMSLPIEGIEDIRGISLIELSEEMSKSNLLISPSSGPAHFAALCELKHLVWGDKFNELKYLDYWNPFKTECKYYHNEGWNPKPESIFNLCL